MKFHRVSSVQAGAVNDWKALLSAVNSQWYKTRKEDWAEAASIGREMQARSWTERVTAGGVAPRSLHG